MAVFVTFFDRLNQPVFKNFERWSKNVTLKGPFTYFVNNIVMFDILFVKV